MAPGQSGWFGLFGIDWVSGSVEDLVTILMIPRYNMGRCGSRRISARSHITASMIDRGSGRRLIGAHDFEVPELQCRTQYPIM